MSGCVAGALLKVSASHTTCFVPVLACPLLHSHLSSTSSTIVPAPFLSLPLCLMIIWDSRVGRGKKAAKKSFFFLEVVSFIFFLLQELFCTNLSRGYWITPHSVTFYCCIRYLHRVGQCRFSEQMVT